jgi:hypothetical protein
MSVSPNDMKGSGDGGAHQSEDQIDFKKVVAVGVVSLVLFAACTAWAVIILRKETGRLEEERGVVAKATQAGREEIGIVDQVHFDADHRLERWQKERARHLTSYGWVDRQRGVIHIPIEKAMEEVAAGRGLEGPEAAGKGSR